jgi:hypothetical protein
MDSERERRRFAVEPAHSLRSRWGIVTIVIVAAFALGAFAVGRATAPSHDASADTSLNSYQVACPDTEPLSRVALPNGGVGYLSMCDFDNAMYSVNGQMRHVEVYASEDRREVVAWFYQDCGMPLGIVAPNTEHPSTCGPASPTGPGAAIATPTT